MNYELSPLEVMKVIDLYEELCKPALESEEVLQRVADDIATKRAQRTANRHSLGALINVDYAKATKDEIEDAKAAIEAIKAKVRKDDN